MSYTPKMWHAVFLILLGDLVIIAGYWSAWFYLGGGALLICALVVLVLLGSEQQDDHIRTMTAYGEMLSRLTVEQWNALGIQYPSIRVRFIGAPVEYFESTNATMADFVRFMHDSTSRQISPERNWTSGKDRRAWSEIKAWLEQNNFIYEASAAGSHSWLWRPGMWDVLFQRYIPHEALIDLNAVQEANRAYLAHSPTD